MACIHSLVPGCETKLLSRPIVLILPDLLISKMKLKYSTCSFFTCISIHSGSCTQSARDSLSPNTNLSKGATAQNRRSHMASYDSAIELWSRQSWNNNYYH